MDEYITKEAALACFSDWIDRYGHEHTADEMVEYQRIEDLPVADVVEVVHGMWEERVEQRTYAGGFLTMHYKACSICGCDPLRDENEDWALSNFCPHCGADMREVGTE